MHCVGMCNGIMVSQTIAKELPGGHQPLQPAVLYNADRLLSYTAIGALVGALGSVIAVSLSLKAGVTLFASSFLILMGLNLIGFRLPLPLPRKLQLLWVQK
ncbi:MAG: sulfite exporter TauE/SafE family protein [Sporomusa sp.]